MAEPKPANLEDAAAATINQALDDVERHRRRITELERLLAESLAGKTPEPEQFDGGVIWVESILSHRDGQPKINLRWGNQMAQMTPDEAREHAHGIVRCADAAESDAFLFKFFSDKIGANAAMAGQILVEFRAFRTETEERNSKKE